MWKAEVKQRTEDGGQMSDDRGQRTEDREQLTESGRRKTESISLIFMQAAPLTASVQPDRNRNFDVVRSATRLQGTRIKIHIIPLCLSALVAKL